MENHIETNFREIQKILDSCIAHDYKTKVSIWVSSSSGVWTISWSAEV